MNKNEEILEQRGKEYGDYRHQAMFVGSTIRNFIDVSRENENFITVETIGSVAYVAIKLARLAVNENHEDTIRDLENYCTLFRKMKLGE